MPPPPPPPPPPIPSPHPLRTHDGKRRRAWRQRLGLVLQLDVALWEQDWRWHCERNFKLSLGSSAVDLFFVDTNPGMSDYQTAAFANHTGDPQQQQQQRS